jgi:hypothetical protein
MKLKDARDNYYVSSGKLSDVVRQLSFAGIAVIWIFRVGDKPGGIAYSTELLIPMACFVMSLGLDFLQYFYASTAWSRFHRYKELSGVDNNEDFKAPAWLNVPTLIFFYSKAVLIFGGYIFLLMEIGRQLVAR